MTGALQDMRVMVVDDSKSMRRILKRFFENSGVTDIREASGGKVALELLGQRMADIVVSDLNMPGMDGMALLETLRADRFEVCFVMLTVEAIQATMNQALELGADAYIVKPVTEAVFIRAVQDALGHRARITSSDRT